MIPISFQHDFEVFTMRKNLPVTDNQCDYDASQRIVSTTDLKGRTTYANDDFIDISGFSLDELIGKSHNIVRHPDMPPAAFDDLWKTIKTGKSWMGIVKNRCANGDYYWVDAFVTPIIEDDHIVGYQSVRLKPDQEDIDSAERTYKQLWNPKKGLAKILTSFKPGLMGKILLSSSTAVVLGIVVSFLLSQSVDLTFTLSCITMLIANFVFAKRIARPWQEAAKEAAKIISNPVAQDVYTGRHDELGQLQLAIRMQHSKLETVIYRINDSTANLKDSVESSLTTVEQTEQNMDNQNKEIEQVATAMNEMTATVNEIAKNTSCTAESTLNAENEVNLGKDIVQSTISHIDALANEVENAVDKINTLANDSKQIGSIVNVITEIAEQTNLLALNAAIEAARAGEQGRGFAVVADEVRTLASRTQSSTHEIQAMVSTLQSSADAAVQVMTRGQDAAEKGVEKAKGAGESLDSISNAVNSITQMTTQIATAAEEQSAVSEEINRNVIRISELSEHTLSGTQMISASSNSVDQSVTQLNSLVKQFGSGL
jgi:aerotaxis receptor